MIKKILFFLLLVMNVQTATFAMTVDDVFYDQHFSLDGQSLSLNGVGLRKIFFVKVYAAGLYLPQTTQSTSFVQEQKGPKRMRLVLRRDVDAADFVEALKDGLQDNSSERQRKSLEKEISTLVTVMEKIGDVKENDRVDFDYSEKQGVRVLLNNRMIGEKIGGQDLYNAVLRIWIGEKSIDDNLKKSLLNL